MILLLDTSTPTCKIYWCNNGAVEEVMWQADRELADKLIGYLRSQMRTRNLRWDDIDGVGIYRGPGSFTGLRIGHTVMNTIADDKGIPIVGTIGSEWIDQAIARLEQGENDNLVLPLYGRDANITKPKK